MNRTAKYLFVILGALLLIGFLLNNSITHREFSSEVWKNWEEDEKNLIYSIRWAMVHNLLNEHELKGKTKAAIIDILGKPTIENDSFYSYNLGVRERRPSIYGNSLVGT